MSARPLTVVISALPTDTLDADRHGNAERRTVRDADARRLRHRRAERAPTETPLDLVPALAG